jgi:uncharacterized membrane protein YkvA (DUF1232 family)
MKRFDKLLEEDVSGYNGDLADLIHQAPALYRLMTRLLDDRGLPKSISPLVIAAIAYFILPEDAIPEDKLGPMGYIDDIFLCAFVADKVAAESGSGDILIRNWDGDRPIVQLTEEILSREKELLGDKRASIMQCIGYEEL